MNTSLCKLFLIIINSNDIDFTDDNLEVTICFLSTEKTLTSTKTKIFKISELYKLNNQKEVAFDLSNNSLLRVFISFDLIGSPTFNKTRSDGPKLTFQTEKRPSLNKEQANYHNLIPNCMLSGKKLTDDVMKQHKNNIPRSNYSCNFNALVNQPNNSTFNSSAKGVSSKNKIFNINSSTAASIMNYNSPKLGNKVNTQYLQKPPIQQRKNSPIALRREVTYQDDEVLEDNHLSKQQSGSIKQFSAGKTNVFKKLLSPERSLHRKNTGPLENLKNKVPQSNNNSLINLMICKSIYSAELIELGYEDYFEYEVGEHFVEAIFLAGLPYNNSKMMIESEKLPSSCNHLECDKLNAFKAEILGKFPGKGRSALDLTSIAASLCFTKGIKLCFTNDLKQIPIIEDYMNMMTNEKGERFYQYNYHFFIKYDLKEFQSKFDVYSILLSNVNIEEDKLILLSELSLKDFVFIPYALCIVSKFPLTQQINSCLVSLINIIFHEKEENSQSFDSITSLKKQKKEELLIDFLKHITYEVPVPSKKELKSKKLKMYLPFCSSPLEIGGYVNEFDFPITAYDLSILLDFLNIENLVIIFHLILHEQKLLFISKSAKIVSMVLECIKAIIYPMKWVNTYIPVLSEELIKFLQCFIPFLMGIEESLMPIAKEYLSSNEGIYIINIDKNIIEVSQKTKKITKKNLK